MCVSRVNHVFVLTVELSSIPSISFLSVNFSFHLLNKLTVCSFIFSWRSLANLRLINIVIVIYLSLQIYKALL